MNGPGGSVQFTLTGAVPPLVRGASNETNTAEPSIDWTSMFAGHVTVIVGGGGGGGGPAGGLPQPATSASVATAVHRAQTRGARTRDIE